uniref:Uncharacterized protein n=1 Tax=Anopheles farauti TaxID=69004 RepID=A0A182QQD2_9DIPT
MCLMQYFAPYTLEQSIGFRSGRSNRSNHSLHWNGVVESVVLQTSLPPAANGPDVYEQHGAASKLSSHCISFASSSLLSDFTFFAALNAPGRSASVPGTTVRKLGSELDPSPPLKHSSSVVAAVRSTPATLPATSPADGCCGDTLIFLRGTCSLVLRSISSCSFFPLVAPPPPAPPPLPPPLAPPTPGAPTAPPTSHSTTFAFFDLPKLPPLRDSLPLVPTPCEVFSVTDEEPVAFNTCRPPVDPPAAPTPADTTLPPLFPPFPPPPPPGPDASRSAAVSASVTILHTPGVAVATDWAPTVPTSPTTGAPSE